MPGPTHSTRTQTLTSTSKPIRAANDESIQIQYSTNLNNTQLLLGFPFVVEVGANANTKQAATQLSPKGETN